MTIFEGDRYQGPRILVSVPLPSDDLFHDDDTEFKVLHALVRAGIPLIEARQVIRHIHEQGILFRERRNFK